MVVVTPVSEMFKEMIREGIGPDLRILGLRGSERNFSWPSEGYFALVGFQTRRTGYRETYTFTINVSVIDKHGWALVRELYPHLPTRPLANVYYSVPNDPRTHFIWQRRIGSLLPDDWPRSLGVDHWWTLCEGQVWHDVAHDVVEAVRRYVLPEFETRAPISPPG
jgi:hypothetical protein